MRPDRIATARYGAAREIIESGMVPVRISRGEPRWSLGYEIAGDVRRLAPSVVEFHIADRISFAARFSDRLDRRHGPDAVLDRLGEIPGAAEHGAVLLCFCDLRTDPDAWCHRQVVARWLHDRTGIDVTDLEPTAGGATDSGDEPGGQTRLPW